MKRNAFKERINALEMNRREGEEERKTFTSFSTLHKKILQDQRKIKRNKKNQIWTF